MSLQRKPIYYLPTPPRQLAALGLATNHPPRSVAAGQIEEDPCEQRNLAEEMPSQLAALLARASELQRGSLPALNDPLRNPNAAEFPAADPKHFGGIWSVWE